MTRFPINGANESFPIPRSLRQNAVRIAVIGLAYFLSHQVSFLFPDSAQVLMAVWPAGGIGLATLLLSPRRLWPAIIAAMFVAGNAANLLSGRPLFNSLGFMTANMIESLGGAWLITRWCGEYVRFNRIREILALISAATLVNAGTAFIGAGTASLAHVAPFWSFWTTWWISDCLGILLIAPLIVTWLTIRDASINTRQIPEGIVFVALVAILAWFAFNPPIISNLLYPHPYFIFALLAWGALRLGQRAVAIALVIMAAIAITSSSLTVGPLTWGGDTPVESVQHAQLFMGFCAITAFLLAASFSEARAAARSSQEDQAMVRAVGDNIPNGFVYQALRDHDGSMRFSYVSAGIEKVFGITAGSVLSDPTALYGLVMEEDLARIIALRETSARELIPMNFDFRIRRPDGRTRWLHLTSSPRRMGDDRIAWDGIIIDVTDRVAVDEALRESQGRFRQVIESAPVIIWAIDAAGTIQFSEGRALAELGLKGGQLVGQSVFELYRNNDKALDLIRQGLAGSEFIDYTEVNDRFWSNSYSPRRDESGNITGLIGVSVDITERRRAEESLKREKDRANILLELHASESRLDDRELYNFALDKAVSLTDSAIGFFHQLTDDGKNIILTTWNKEALRDCSAVFSDHYPIARAGNWVDCVRTNAPVVYNDYNNSPNRKGMPEGHAPVRRFMSIPVMEGGLVRFIFGVGNKPRDYDEMDIVQIQLIANELNKIVLRRHTEHALQESEERYRRITDSVTHYIYSVRVEDGRPAETVHGAACKAVTGYSETDFAADPYLWYTMIHEEDREAVKRLAERTMAGGTSEELEHRIWRRDGRLRWVRNRLVPHYGPGGILVSYDGLISDITERKNAEEMITASLREKEVLLKEIHHRVKNNMQVIMSLLSMKSKKVSDPDAVKAFQESQGRIFSMALIHERLYRSGDFSRIDMGEYTQSLLSEIFTLFGVSQEKIECRVDIDRIGIGIDQAIPFGLVLNELITNSIKYAFPPESAAKGEILIAMKREAGSLETIFADNGIGMPDAVNHGDTETAGLTLVRMIIEKQLKGTFRHSNEPGTRYIIRIPEHATGLSAG